MLIEIIHLFIFIKDIPQYNNFMIFENFAF